MDQIKETLIRGNVDAPEETSTTDIRISDGGVPHQEDSDPNKIPGQPSGNDDETDSCAERESTPPAQPQE